MKFDNLVTVILEKYGTRITTGADEIRDVLQNQRLQSREPAYKGHTFFTNKPGIDDSNKQYLPRPGYKDKFGSRLGYVMKVGAEALQDVPKDITTGAPYPEYYADRGYKVTRPGTASSNIKTIQRIKVSPQLNQFKEKDIVLGKERNFDRFQRLYSKLVDAYKSGRIQVRPPRITGSGAGGALALMAFVNNELPPDQRNAMMGGMGIEGKFEATP